MKVDVSPNYAAIFLDGGTSPQPDPIADTLVNNRRAVDGATFILDASQDVQPVWGNGEQVVWAQGEALILAGPDGVGKTTLGQQLALARLGLRTELLGFPVVPEPRRVLYIAADRPSQAQRSLRRMVTDEDRDVLAEKLIVWKGPLPVDLGKSPEFLLDLAQMYAAGTVVLDSLKDVAMDLTKDEVGSRVNHAVQTVLAEGVEVLTLHHQRKAQAGAPRPKALPDVYGSRWLTAGAGSVVMLWGDPGDSVVELLHLKQPLDDVGPLRVMHDHYTGRSALVDLVDPYVLVIGAPKGTTATEVACKLFSTSQPSRNQIEKARRRLDGLHRVGKVHKKDGGRGGGDDRNPARYFPLSVFQEAS